ncbi:hypothetical protein J4211_05785 [Candidatus Woesearchaeota archaeon]|nr:hypothetical protein [Candidatus Woesearchaeota archaeon]
MNSNTLNQISKLCASLNWLCQHLFNKKMLFAKFLKQCWLI